MSKQRMRKIAAGAGYPAEQKRANQPRMIESDGLNRAERRRLKRHPEQLIARLGIHRPTPAGEEP
jgi:hypothetical protein